MAKQIIVLNTGNPWPGQLSVTYAMWASVPTARQFIYALSAPSVSAYVSASSTEIAAIKSGAIAEKVQTTNIPTGTSTPTIKGILIDAFTAFQNSINNESTYQYYGTFYDGSTWTNGGF